MAARISRHVRDRSAEPGAPDPLRDPQRARRRARRAHLRAVVRPATPRCGPSGVPLFSVDTPPCGGRFDVLAFNLSSELVYTNVLEMIDLAGAPIHAADRGDDDLHRHRRRPRRLQPRAARRLHRRRRARRGRRGRRRHHRGARTTGSVAGRTDREVVLRRARSGPRRVRAVDVRGHLRRADRRRSDRCGRTRRTPTCRPTVDKRTVADLGEWPYPKRPLVPLTEVVHDRLSVEVFRGCTRGCRFCQAGHDHPPGARTPGRTGSHDDPRGSALARGYDEVSLTSLSTADFSDIEPVVKGVLADNRRHPRLRATRSRSTCRRCGSTPSPSASPAR